MNSFGLNLTINRKAKTIDSNIQSAFVKGLAKNEKVKIKFEVDTDPPAFASFERKYRLLPHP